MKLKDLRRGMRCTNREGDVYVIDCVHFDWDDMAWRIDFIGDSKYGYCAVSSIEEDLTNGNGHVEVDIMKVEDIGIDGYKTIWERPKEKYYLRLPKIYTQNFFANNSYLNYVISDNRYIFDGKEERSQYKTQFTQEEIDVLPRQDFIKSLDKVPVNKEEK